MLCQGRREGLLQLQFQQALTALPEMEGRIVAIEVPDEALIALPVMEGRAVAVKAAVFADKGCSGEER